MLYAICRLEQLNVRFPVECLNMSSFRKDPQSNSVLSVFCCYTSFSLNVFVVCIQFSKSFGSSFTLNLNYCLIGAKINQVSVDVGVCVCAFS